MKKKYIGALDLGTTSVRFIIFDKKSNVVSVSQKEHKQIYPKQNYVEHDPIEIWRNTQFVISDAISKANISVTELAAIGITNQRETTVMWNKITKRPYYNAIVWQDTRTDNICKKLKKHENMIKDKTGLPLATYFSATKIKWLIDNLPDLKKDIEKNNALFGTIDTWILWNLTGGKNHITDVTNASRTMLMNLKTLDWDKELLDIFDLPTSILPKIHSSSEIFGYTTINDAKVPISGILGDQQAALFGQKCFNEGDAKNTYGTGCFLLMNTGSKIIRSKNGLITTVACKIGKEKAQYALEGSVAIAGSLVQWLRDNLGIIKSASEINNLATKVKDNGGVYFVPAFSGLFAPYWDNSARGIITGLTHFANKNHIARAVLEAVAFQAKDIFMAMQTDTKKELKRIKVDGGMTASNVLMQFQADILNIPIIKSKLNEITALGAAYAAGLAVKFWENREELADIKTEEYHPKMSDKNRNKFYSEWKKAINQSKGWIKNEL